MRSNPTVAVVGATGQVGAVMRRLLDERGFPLGEIRFLASARSAGTTLPWKGRDIVVEDAATADLSGIDIALFSAGGATSKALAEKFAAAGAVVIDNSSAWRMDPDVPLIVTEVNPDDVSYARRKNIIANPNCSTAQLVVALKPLHERARIKRVVVSTYQSVSGAGKAALDELWGQTIAICNQQEMPQECFQHQIAFNCIPQIDVLLEDGFTKEEHKIINESRKILGLQNLRITATAVRVPVFYAHAESVFVETERPASVASLHGALRAMPGVAVHENADEYPLQIDVAGRDDIHVGRIRKDHTVENGFSMWIVADNVRKGAALNAVQILEHLMARPH